MDEVNEVVVAENISTISSKSHIKYNSVNIAIGKKNSGKRHRIMKDIIYTAN
jgi:hypothetical protein